MGGIVKNGEDGRRKLALAVNFHDVQCQADNKRAAAQRRSKRPIRDL
jgi:hypothetical protein